MKHKKGWQEYLVAIRREVTMPDETKRQVPVGEVVSGTNVVIEGSEQYKFFIHQS